MTKYMIGIDAGGTKTKAVAYDAKGTILCTFEAGSGSPAVVKEEDVWLHVEEAISAVLNKLKEQSFQLVYIQMGMSAFSILKDVKSTEQYFKTKYQTEVSIESDTLIAMHSILKNQYHQGVVVLSGTGVAIYGMKENETCLIGGWGHIIREWGSAYATVHELCLQIIDKWEESKPLNALEEKFLNALKERNIEDVKHLFYYHTKDEVASFVRIIKEEANKKDKNAKLLLKHAGMLLGKQVIRAIKKLNLCYPFVIGFRGGFIQYQNEDICNGFFEVMKENHYEDAIFVIDEEDPAKGAYYLTKLKQVF